jgi:esterase
VSLNYHISTSSEQKSEQTNLKPVVLLHGLFGKQDNLGLLKQALQPHYSIISVDLRNHGASTWHADMNYHAMSNDILNLLTNLNIPKAHLLGHSMGGKVAMAVALQAPETVSSLIVADIAPVNYTEHRHLAVFKALNAVANAHVTSRKEADIVMSDYLTEPAVRQFLLKSFSNEHPTHWQFNLNVLEQHYAEIMSWPFTAEQRYTGPALFIKGGASDYLLTEHQESVVQHFTQSSARVMPGCGHWLHAEKPILFNGIVERFLQNQIA